MACIELKDVSYSYPTSKKWDICHVDLQVEKGEFVAIIGPNGAGKTTLCNVIRGFAPHFFQGTIKGSVTVNNKNVLETEIGDLAMDIGYVFQNPFNQNSGIKKTVYEEITFGLENLGIPREEIFRKVDDIMNLLNIVPLADKNPAELSGGQMQRVALASVIIMEPMVLLIDEPTSQLDPKGTKDVFEIIDTLKKHGHTTLLVEHKIDHIAEYADRVILLDNGKIVKDGPAQEILSDPTLEEYGMSIPQTARAGLALREEGYVISEIPITVDKAVHTIGDLWKKEKS